MIVLSFWMIVQLADIFMHNIKNSNEDGLYERIENCENRIKECSVYAPQCNPAVFYQVPKPEDCKQHDKDIIAQQKEECRKQVNKAYGSVKWYAEKMAQDIINSGSGSLIPNPK